MVVEVDLGVVSNKVDDVLCSKPVVVPFETILETDSDMSEVVVVIGESELDPVVVAAEEEMVLSGGSVTAKFPVSVVSGDNVSDAD